MILAFKLVLSLVSVAAADLEKKLGDVIELDDGPRDQLVVSQALSAK